MNEAIKQHDITQALQKMLCGVRWVAMPGDAAEASYRQERDAFTHSKQNKNWVRKYSCDYTLIGSHFAVVVGLVKWAAIEQFFDFVGWGGIEAVPHYAKLRSCFTQHGNVRVWWSGELERIDVPGDFIVIPTSAIAEGEIDSKLTAYESQSKLPERLRFNQIDIPNYCRNFSKYAQQFHSHNETKEEFEFRILRKFVEIFDYIN